ncbi:divalent metal cation transporter [Nostoc sp. NOS(2021)]|uniref:divalent metal cation transporter n=1 Tax=Nostoc sp. NOS(2021) TaxID=2815407 RepID=UPI0025DC1A1F|nr:divalent metal cation transporter [Nostoc sp. NOS(2021)]
MTALDVLVLLFLQHKGFRYTQALIIMLVATVGFCFTAEILFSRPDLGGIIFEYLPIKSIFLNFSLIY